MKLKKRNKLKMIVKCELKLGYTLKHHSYSQKLLEGTSHTLNNHLCFCVWICAVPDDWCAPLGCESLTNKEEVICPSIRLRRLSIPLWHIPLIKTEVCN